MVRTANKHLIGLCAADIMSDHVVMIPREMSLQGAARMLARAGVTGAPVVDDDGRCIGVLSATDFMHVIETERPNGKHHQHGESMCSAWQILPDDAPQASCCVAEFMTKDPVLVFAGTKIGDMAHMMIDAHIHRLIVVDCVTHRPIGIVSSMDILAAIAREERMLAEESKAECALADTMY